MSTQTKKRRSLTGEVTFAALPGPTRKRLPSPYCYRMTFRNGDPAGVGCAMMWDVMGGREIYQVALERQASGRLRWHCTCADAVYRGDTIRHVCKHVRGLQTQGRGGHEIDLSGN